MEYVAYHALSAKFRSLGDVLLIQLYCLQTRHQEDYDTICWLFQNPVFQLVQVMICKD